MALSINQLLAQASTASTKTDNLAECTFDHLRVLTAECGIDVATAIAFSQVANDPAHRSFIAEVDIACNHPEIPQLKGSCGIALVPNLGFFLDRKSRDVWERIASAARELGFVPYEIKTDPGLDLRSNARIVCNAIASAPFDELIVLSLSKGSADVKMAFEEDSSEIAFARVKAWLNVCGLLDGCPAINVLFSDEAAADELAVRWFHNQDPSEVRKILHCCRECGRGHSFPLSSPLELPPHVSMFNVLAFPTSETLSYEHTKFFHSILASDGPNDGFGLLADQIGAPGLIYPVWGADHYLDRYLDVHRLAKGLLTVIQERCGIGTPSAPVGRGQSTRQCLASATIQLRSSDKDPSDHERLRHARQRETGFAVGRYLQPPPMLFTRDGLNVFLGDMYRGVSAFLIGSGPSLLSHPLERLQERGVLTLGVNNSATVVRPRLWVSIDDPGNFADAIWRDPGILKFVPLCHMEKPFTERDSQGELIPSSEVVGDMPAVFGFRRNERFAPQQWLYEDTFNWGNQSNYVDDLGNKGSRSVMYVALRLLFYLGVRDVYLVGCDFRMQVGKQNYAFPQDRTRSSVRGNNSSYSVLNRRLAALRPYFEREGFAVWNCTPDSGLTVFPYLDFDQAVDRATRAIPATIQTEGMYDRLRREREKTQTEQPNRPPAVSHATDARGPSEKLPIELTLVVAVDDRSASELAESWASWMHFKTQLRELPVILIHNASISPNDPRLATIREHRQLSIVEWSNGDSRRTDWQAHAKLHVPAAKVTTPWYLLLDTNVAANSETAWTEPEWFLPDNRGLEPAFVAWSWGYTKPADLLAQLDDWGDRVDELRDNPRLSIPFDPAADRVEHSRIVSWCFFGNTGWTRDVARLAADRLPCADHDTFCFYTAARRGDHMVRVNMSHFGWVRHTGRRRRRDFSRSAEAARIAASVVR